jgi:superfamily II DNA or RNA helicase
VPRPPTWREQLARVAPDVPLGVEPVEDLHYFIDLSSSHDRGLLVLELRERSRKPNGEWGKFRTLRLDRRHLMSRIGREIDRNILGLLIGARQYRAESAWPAWASAEAVPSSIEVSEALTPYLMDLLCACGRAHLSDAGLEEDGPTLDCDFAEPWQLYLQVRQGEGEPSGYVVKGMLRRGTETLPLSEPTLLLRGGFLVTAGTVARLEHAGAFDWITLLRRVRQLQVPATEIDELVARIFSFAAAPPLDLPAELHYDEVQATPALSLRLLAPGSQSSPSSPPPDTAGMPAAAFSSSSLRAEVAFRYGEVVVSPTDPRPRLYAPAQRRLLRRDRDLEARAAARLVELGFRPLPAPAAQLLIDRRRLPEVVRLLLAEDWRVEAEGRRVHAPSRFDLAVASKIDWFELAGGVDFDGQTVPFPVLLAALRSGEGTIRLGDGTVGLLPEEWLARLEPLAAFGEEAGDRLRFRPAHVGLLAALVEEEPAATCDAAFALARRRFESVAAIEPAAAPRGFQGELRGYQAHGLGWLHFLRELGFGGCLADDMGLGKTVQVLALLESRRGARGRQGPPRPSLVVVPRSLVFNWIAEAARFTPRLRVRNHTGPERWQHGEGFAGCDLVLTTYGTLRRDVAALREVEFDYIVLDEAQAIKNPHSQSAKAARLLVGGHRLALTGTPVENHLGDLWSLLEFLNPGITGASSLLGAAGAALRNPDPETRQQLSRALRPFILRRTKEQVAPELPAKVEQTIYCELPARQRRLYDELRNHYRAALGARLQERGLGRVKILVLEALLRLRQAACHPGLLDRERTLEASGKLEYLLPQLAEVLAGGHKALVFSQFTTFLGILRQHLDRAGLAYTYLDGHTRDRAERVARFQEDPDCKLFLISLKAGGLGLNLTAAEYVYLLDPWWNPAVEAQAIDRAHRIGQSRQVFAYRVVARDTVEEKILELQRTKRDLADAIVTADESLLRRLTREDLDLLLS